MNTSIFIDVPDALAASYSKHSGASGRAWITALPGLATDFLDRWALRLDGPAGHGMASLVLPVIRADGTPGALKLQPVSEENASEPIGLRVWDGDGVVRLLDHDPDTGTMLLERLDATRPLSSVADDTAALEILAELLARLVAVPAPEGLRHLADIAAAMLDQVPRAVPTLRDPIEQRLVRTCASAVAELIGEPCDRLLHWDLHYDNILAEQREPWLAIDPKPLAGDPGFDLLPALDNRWDEVVATGDVTRAVLRRFDLLTEVLGLDRQRATRLDARPRAAERAVGHRGRRDRTGPNPDRHRHSPAASSSAGPVARLIAGNADRASQRILMQRWMWHVNPSCGSCAGWFGRPATVHVQHRCLALLDVG